MTKAELHWIVGFYEGEGTAGCWKTGGKYNYRRLLVSIAQKEKYILEWIKKTVGYGCIATETNAGINHGTIHSWRCGDRKARVFLQLIIPHLRSRYKTKQATDALKLDAKCINPNYVLSKNDKQLIRMYLRRGLGAYEIAPLIKRHVTTIYRFIRKDRV